MSLGPSNDNPRTFDSIMEANRNRFKKLIPSYRYVSLIVCNTLSLGIRNSIALHRTPLNLVDIVPKSGWSLDEDTICMHRSLAMLWIPLVSETLLHRAILSLKSNIRLHYSVLMWCINLHFIARITPAIWTVMEYWCLWRCVIAGIARLMYIFKAAFPHSACRESGNYSDLRWASQSFISATRILVLFDHSS